MFARGRFAGMFVALMLGSAMLTSVLVFVPGVSTALPEDAWITGVVDDGVDPVPDVYMKVMLFTAGGMDIGYAFTDAAGEYTIAVPGGFDYYVIAANGSYYMSMSMCSVDVGETAWANVSLTPISPVEADVTVKGYVKDGDGTPAAGGHVLGISNDPMGGDMPFYANVTSPDVSGYFEVNVIPSDAGGGSVAFDNPGYPMTTNETDSPLESGQTYWFNITLVTASDVDDSTLSGTVTEADTGLPIEGVLVTAEIWNMYLPEGYANFTFTDASGHYEMNVTNGTADIWFTKGGYSIAMFDEETIPSGGDIVLDVELRVLNCVVRGNITDGGTGLPIEMARAVVMDMYGSIAMAMTDASGAYELEAFDGDGLWLAAEADGYSRDLVVLDLSPGDEVWQDFELYPVSAWLEGTVTDVLTGLPVEGAWVYAESDIYGDEDDTDASGYYNISVVPGDYTVGVNSMDYRYASADVTVADGTTEVLDFELLPWDLEESTLVSGFVYDADTLDPIQGAHVYVALPDYSGQNQTDTGWDGYYEMYVAPLDDLPVMVTAYAHAPYFDTLMCAGVTDLSLDVELELDPYAPNLTYSQSPLENVSWTNPMTVHAEVEDQNLRQIVLFNFAPWYTQEGEAFLYLIEGSSVSFDPFSPSDSLAYTQVGDNYTVHEEFDGTVDSDHYTGGWLDDGAEPYYLTASLTWWGPQLLYGLRGYYTNDSLTSMSGTAYFDSATGEYLMFSFDWGMPEAEADDPNGYFEATVNYMSYEEANPSNWTWHSETAITGDMVGSLVFTAEPVAPSGTYAMLFGMNDFGDQGLWFITPYTVDNDPPVADAGPDRGVVVDTVCTFDGSGSSDDVVNYTWTFEDDGTPVVRYEETFDYTFTVLGEYEVALAVVDGAGHMTNDTAVVTVLADGVPVADAGPDQEVDEDTLVEFDGSGSDDDVDVANYSWTIVELSEDMSGVSPSYTFPEPGVYTVELVVRDTIGQESEPDTMTVTVIDVTDPTANAGPDQEVSFGDEVTFSGSGTDNVAVTSYVWTFDDDGTVTLTGATVDHMFSAPGEYIVTLTVEDAAGNDDTDTMTVTVVDDEAPVADAGEDPEDVRAGDTVVFDAAGSTDNAGIVEYAWTFTDVGETTLYGVEVEYTFEAEGEFTVTLTVTDAAGLSDTDTVLVVVSEANEAPVADAGDDMEAVEGDTVTFDGSGSTDDVEVVSWTWTFEYDGELVTLTGETVEFEFEIPDTYTVTLNVTDGDGAWDTDMVYVLVEEKSTTLLTDYWWVFASIAAVAVIGALAVLMRGGKDGPRQSKDAHDGDEFEDEEEELPPPDDEDL